MNKSVPEEFRHAWPAAERKALESIWDALDEDLTDLPSARMRRRLRRLLWSERLRSMSGWLAPAGMAASLAVGLLIGRLMWLPTPADASPDFRLEAKVLVGDTTSARLEAIVNLRRAPGLPEHAVVSLASVVRSHEASTGVRLAALDALLTHAGQVDVQAQVIDLLQQQADNPMLEARLREASPAGGGTQL